MADKNSSSDLANKYQKLSQKEHILLRPDTYIGSVESNTQSLWVFDHDCQGIVQKEISYVPGLYKIFDEILVNAVDNYHKNPNAMTYIKVDIDQANGTISVCNDGDTIPIEIHPKEKIY